MNALSGGFSNAPVQSAANFRTILGVMARPGQTAAIPGHHGPAPLSPAAAAVLLTLVDRTTPLYLAPGHDTDAMRAWIAFHCGAPITGAEDAGFALGEWSALTSAVGRFAIGTPEYPDRAATLIVDNHDFDRAASILRGPGIRDAAQIALPQPEVFQVNHARFPLGWDTIFCGGDRIAALPRSTEVC